MLIVLNDNEMSISPTVGAMSQYLSRIKLSRTWRGSQARLRRHRRALPVIGPTRLEWSRRRLRSAVVDFAQPGQLFEDLGITYVGPGPGPRPARAGRDLRGHCSTWTARSSSTSARRRAAAIGRPKPTRSASTAPPCRRWPPGRATPRPGRPGRQRRRRHALGRPGGGRREGRPTTRPSWPTSSSTSPATDPRVVAITAGMPTGTGLVALRRRVSRTACSTWASPSSTP